MNSPFIVLKYISEFNYIIVVLNTNGICIHFNMKYLHLNIKISKMSKYSSFYTLKL